MWLSPASFSRIIKISGGLGSDNGQKSQRMWLRQASGDSTHCTYTFPLRDEGNCSPISWKWLKLQGRVSISSFPARLLFPGNGSQGGSAVSLTVGQFYISSDRYSRSSHLSQCNLLKPKFPHKAIISYCSLKSNFQEIILINGLKVLNKLKAS